MGKYGSTLTGNQRSIKTKPVSKKPLKEGIDVMYTNQGRMPDIREKMNNMSKKFVENAKSKAVKQFALRISTYDILAEKLRNLMETELRREKVAIWGNGNATQELFLIVKMLKNLVCVVDRQPKNSLLFSFENIPVCSPEQLQDYSPTTVVIPTKKYEEEIKQELQAMGFQGRVIGIHTWLIEQGIALDKAFFAYRYDEKYWMLNEMYLRYRQNPERENLHCIVIGLLLIRDYSHVIQIIDEFDKDHSDYLLQDLKSQIVGIFEQIRQCLQENTKKHCMMYVIDSLRYDEMLNMPYLKKIADMNFSFETYMTQYGNTRESVVTMLTGYKIIEDKLYQTKYFTRNDGVLLPYLTKEKYKFNYIVDHHIYPFAKIDDMDKACISRNAPEVFFEGLCAILESDENTFNYMQCIAEIHPPFLNPFFEKRPKRAGETYAYEEYMEQYRSSQKYVDEVMWFYYELFEETEITLLILGDHGIDHENSWLMMSDGYQHRLGKDKYEKELLNPAFIIVDKNIGKGSNSNVVCNYNLAEIIRRLLEKSISVEELEYLDNGYVALVSIPQYSKWYIDRYINRGDMQMNYGYVGIWTKQDVYVEREDGEKLYFVHGNKENLISDERYQNKISEYATMVDHDAIEEMLKLDKFEYHKSVLKKSQADKKK